MIEYCELLQINGERFELMTNLNVLFKSLAEVNFTGASLSQLEQRDQLLLKINEMKSSVLLKYKKKIVADSFTHQYEKVTNWLSNNFDILTCIFFFFLLFYTYYFIPSPSSSPYPSTARSEVQTGKRKIRKWYTAFHCSIFQITVLPLTKSKNQVVKDFISFNEGSKNIKNHKSIYQSI